MWMVVIYYKRVCMAHSIVGVDGTLNVNMGGWQVRMFMFNGFWVLRRPEL